MFRTLSARLFAVLMVGLGTIQIVSFFGFMVFRGEEIKEQMMRFLGADVSFAYELMRRAHLAITPGRDFGTADTQRFVRFSTANSMAQLQEAVARLQRLID